MRYRTNFPLLKQSRMFIESRSTANMEELLKISKEKVWMSETLPVTHHLKEYLYEMEIAKGPIYRANSKEEEDSQHVLSE